MKSRLLTLKRLNKQIITLSFDIIILIFSLWLSFALRFGEPWNSYLNENLWLFIFVPVVATPLFVKLGLYRSVFSIGIKVITTSFKAITMPFYDYIFMYFFQEDDLPRSILQFFGLFLIHLSLLQDFY